MGLVTVDDENFTGFYIKVIGKNAALEVSGALLHKSFMNSILQVTLLCPKTWDEVKATNTLAAVLKSVTKK